MSSVEPKTPQTLGPDLPAPERPPDVKVVQIEKTLTAVAPRAISQSAETLDSPQPSSRKEEQKLRLVDPSNYSVSGQIAEGGIGRIYRARDERLDRPVALKELLDPAGGAEQRFVREALVTARLQHPAIVPVYEAGRWPSGEPFYAMKLVAGRSFAEVIDETRTLDQRLALLPHVLAVAEAMAYAHGEQIIHRDLKPANILIGDFGETVVIDWGLAKDLRMDDAVERPIAVKPRDNAEADPPPSSGGITLAGAILGTPAYMPPEQAAGKAVDARADVYAIGALLYHLLAGVPPYEGRSALEILRKVLAGSPPPLSRKQAGVPPDLVTLVDKAMARDPAARYATAKELSEDLRRFETGQIVGAHHYSRRERLQRFVRRYRLPLAVALSALVMVATLSTASVRRIIEERRVAQRERDRAEEQRDLAARRQAEAEQARKQATERADKLTLVEASSVVPRDPNEAIAWLKSLSPSFDRWGEARLIAADAESRSIATVLRGHKGPVDQIAYSPDSRSVATFSDDHTVRLWGLDGKLLRTLEGHEDEVWNGAFSPDGKRLVSGSKDGTIRLWELETGVVKVLRGHTSGIVALHFSPDGRHIVSKGRFDSVRLWDVETSDGQVLPGGPSSNWPAIFSPDGKMVVYAGDQKLVVWSSAGAASRSFPLAAKGIESMVFSPDGSFVAVGGADGVTWLVDVRTGAPRRLHVHAGAILEVGFSPTGSTVVSASRDGLVGVFDLRTGVHSMLRGPEHQVYRVRVSPDGAQIASAAGDGTVRLWDPTTGQSRTLGGLRDVVSALCYSPDGKRLAAASYDHSARIWDLERPWERVIARHQKRANQAVFSPDGRLVASGGEDGTLLLTTLSSGETSVMTHHDGAIRTIGFSRDGANVISAGDDGRIRVSSVADKRSTAREAHEGPIHHVALSPDGVHFASGGKDGALRLWQIADGEPRILQQHEGEITALAFAPDGKRLASGGADGTVRIVNLEGGEPRTLGNHQGPIGAVAFSPDGLFLVSSSKDHTLRIWDASSLLVLHSIDASGEGITRIVFGEGGAVFATAGWEAPIHVWETASGKRRAVLRGHSARVVGLAVSSDGTRVASSDVRGMVRLWDLRSGASRDLAKQGAPGTWITFSQDGKWLASAAEDGMVRLWKEDLPQDSDGLRAWFAAATPDSLAQYGAPLEATQQ